MSSEYSILCVDDEPIILKALERVLRPEGYTVFTALSGMEGLDILGKEKIDLIIADQRMPQMSGSEFLRQARETYPDIIRIMLSGYSDFNSLVRAINEGEIFRFLSKPWQNDELREVLNTAFEQKRVLNMVKGVIDNIGAMAKFAEGVTVETSQDQGFVDLKISEQGKVFSEEAVFKFLNLIFDTFGIEQERVKMVSGAVSKHKGTVILTIDIGKGVALRIEMPNANE